MNSQPPTGAIVAKLGLFAFLLICVSHIGLKWYLENKSVVDNKLRSLFGWDSNHVASFLAKVFAGLGVFYLLLAVIKVFPVMVPNPEHSWYDFLKFWKRVPEKIPSSYFHFTDVGNWLVYSTVAACFFWVSFHLNAYARYSDKVSIGSAKKGVFLAAILVSIIYTYSLMQSK